MSIADLLGLAVVFVAGALIVGFWAWARRTGAPPALRPVDAFRDLPQKTGESVEAGKRIHVSLGSGVIGSQNTAAALAGLTVLEVIAAAATISDRPPIVTAGDGASMILAQDTLRRVYRRQNALERYDHLAGRLAGPTPLSYAAAVMTAQKDEAVSTNILIGSLGNELALMADAGWGRQAHQIIGTDTPQAQAMSYVTADQPLIGEDVFASGAYLLGGNPVHKASLQTQDVLRAVVIAAIVIGALLKLVSLL